MKFFKDICAAKYTNCWVNIFNWSNLQAGSYEVFPKSSKETSKVCLVARYLIPFEVVGGAIVLKTSTYCRVVIIGSRAVLKTVGPEMGFRVRVPDPALCSRSSVGRAFPW